MSYSKEELSKYLSVDADRKIKNLKTGKELKALMITIPIEIRKDTVGMSREKLIRIMLDEEPYNHKEHMRKVLGASSKNIEDYYELQGEDVVRIKTGVVLGHKDTINLPAAIVEDIDREHATVHEIREALLLGGQIKEKVMGNSIHDYFAFVPIGVRRGNSTYTTYRGEEKIIYTIDKFGLRVEPNGYVLLTHKESKWSCYTGKQIWMPECLSNQHDRNQLARLRVIGWLTFGEIPDERTIRVSSDGVEIVDPGLSQSFAGIRNNNTSGFKGVCQSGFFWKAYFRRQLLGVFNTPQEAYRAHVEERDAQYGDPQSHFYVREMDGRELHRDLDHYLKSGGEKKPN